MWRAGRRERYLKRIREQRERKGLTQEELGRMLGRTQQSISSWESGTRGLKVSELPGIASALECSMADLIVQPSEPWDAAEESEKASG
jgi:transcriptional regulator with XRE-family HTH domain